MLADVVVGYQNKVSEEPSTLTSDGHRQRHTVPTFAWLLAENLMMAIRHGIVATIVMRQILMKKNICRNKFMMTKIRNVHMTKVR